MNANSIRKKDGFAGQIAKFHYNKTDHCASDNPAIAPDATSKFLIFSTVLPVFVLDISKNDASLFFLLLLLVANLFRQYFNSIAIGGYRMVVFVYETDAVYR
jgi:hypothetical protein